MKVFVSNVSLGFDVSFFDEKELLGVRDSKEIVSYLVDFSDKWLLRSGSYKDLRDFLSKSLIILSKEGQVEHIPLIHAINILGGD